MKSSHKYQGAALKVLLSAAAAAMLLAPFAGRAQISLDLKFSSPPNPVGSGGRAIGWGGAFIAVSDDATAASWNPGGLVQLLTPETSVALSYHTRLETVDFSGLSSSSESSPRSGMKINYASVVYPFHVGNANMVASLNYQRMFDFDRDLEYKASGVLEGATTFTQKLRLEQAGALTTVTPAFCIQVLPQWSVGVAVNIWGLDPAGDSWEQQWEQTTAFHNPAYAGYTTLESWARQQQTYELSGVNYVFGTHYKISNFTVGLVYKTAWEADIDYEFKQQTAQYNHQNPIASSAGALTVKDDRVLVWPESYGLGLAYRYSDRLSFALDTYTTRWSTFKEKDSGNPPYPISGVDNKADIVDTWQVRAGAEYLWIMPKYVFALRGGAFYDPEPYGDEVLEFYGASLGGGLVYKNMALDAALQYRWSTNNPGERVMGSDSETDTSEFLAILSMIYYFPGLAQQ